MSISQRLCVQGLLGRGCDMNYNVYRAYYRRSLIDSSLTNDEQYIDLGAEHFDRRFGDSILECVNLGCWGSAS